MKGKRTAALLLATAMAFSQTGCGENSQQEETGAAVGSVGEENSDDLSLSKYTDQVTIHLGGRMNTNSKLPEGMSFDDNVYTDLLKEDLNINIEYDWICSQSDYDEKLNLCIGSNTIPDLMNVSATQYRALLKYDLIQPLGDYYDRYASDLLKSFIESGGSVLRDCVTNEDGEMMAIPAPSMKSNGIYAMWIRQDWLDKLGLEAPRTWDELVEVAEAFVTQDPDGNGKDDTIGILGPSNSDKLVARGEYAYYPLDPLFAAHQSYPKMWMEDEDGQVTYGSIQPETKEALEAISELYKQGLIDPEMLIRSDSTEALLSGNVGIFFGAWYYSFFAADTLLSGECDWQAYLVPLAEDGKYYTQMIDPTTSYIVASKNCKNPEAAYKIINYLIANETKWIEEGISSTEMSSGDFYPLYSVFDNADEIEQSYEILKQYLNNEITMEDVDFSTHKLLEGDMQAITELKKEPLDDFSLKYWDLDSDLAVGNLPRLVGIMVGGGALVEEEYVQMYSLYSGQTETMETKWANLLKLEEETFARIVMGKADIDEFDAFVEEWKSIGGEEIIQEINEELANSK